MGTPALAGAALAHIMWLTNDVIDQVDKAAVIRYIDLQACITWNAHRQPGEIRLLTGWEWIARDKSGRHRQGFKTQTVAYRDAYYTLVRHEDAPSLLVARAKLRIVK